MDRADQQVRERRGVKPGSKVDKLLNNDSPLDVHEQDEVVEVLEEEAVRQARFFRRVFAVLTLMVAAFFAYAAIQQQQHPWEFQFTGQLRPVTSQPTVVAVLGLQAVALGLGAAGLLVRLPKPWERCRTCMPPAQQSRFLVVASIFVAAVAGLYWGSALYRSVAKYGYDVGAHFDLIWLPLGPLGFCYLCWHVLSSLEGTYKELQDLKGLGYDYKKV
jgi:hypothetical protein